MTIETNVRAAEFRATHFWGGAALVGALGATTSAASEVATIVRSGASVWSVLQLLASLYGVGFMGWFAYSALRHPVVRIARDRIQWRHLLSLRWQEVRLADVMGKRWQDSFDLRLQMRSGEERSLFLNAIGSKDRARLSAVLDQALAVE